MGSSSKASNTGNEQEVRVKAKKNDPIAVMNTLARVTIEVRASITDWFMQTQITHNSRIKNQLLLSVLT